MSWKVVKIKDKLSGLRINEVVGWGRGESELEPFATPIWSEKNENDWKWQRMQKRAWGSEEEGEKMAYKHFTLMVLQAATKTK